MAERLNLNPFYYVHKQAAFLSIGAFLIFIFSVMPITALRRVALIGFLGSIFLLILVHFYGYDVKGAKRWIRIFGTPMQPSEFVKPFFAVAIAWVLARKSMVENFPGFKIATAIYALVVVLIVFQPDFGMTVAISLVWAAQMFLAGLPMLWIGVIIVLGVIGFVGGYLAFPHVADRVNMFLNSSSGDNYQSKKALEAFMDGGFLGRGPGEGVLKNTIPDSHTDFIFAVAGEELGLIVCLAIIVLFCFIVVRGFSRIFRESNLFVVYAAAGLLVEFGMQAIINMGVALSLLPNTGMTLPFISYGGSSTLAISISMGMILAFTRRRYGTIMPARKKMDE